MDDRPVVPLRDEHAHRVALGGRLVRGELVRELEGERAHATPASSRAP